MAAVRRPACGAYCSSLLASLLFIAMLTAIFTLAAGAVAKAAGDEPDPDRAHERLGGPADCPMECATKLTGFIMETVKCYVACMGGGGGGGGGLSAAEEEMRSTPRPPSCEGGRVIVVGDASWGDSLVTITACIQERKSGTPSDKILQ